MIEERKFEIQSENLAEAQNNGADTPEYFGVVRWCDEDIIAALNESGIPADENNVARVISLLQHHSFTDVMIERGWDHIYTTIDNLKNEGVLKESAGDVNDQ